MAKMELSELLLGGPGHDGYAYNASTYCVGCGQQIIRVLYDVEPPESTADIEDSNEWPQPIFFGESDCAQHCDGCGEYLYGEQPDGDDSDGDDSEQPDDDTMEGE